MPVKYEIRLAGVLDERAWDALADLDVACDGSVTVVVGDLDQAGLHGLLERIRRTGLELIDVHRIRRSPR